MELGDEYFNFENGDVDVKSEEASPVIEFEPDFENIITESVEILIGECSKLIHKTEGPYLPLSMTLYRTIAYKKFKTLLVTKMKNGQ